MENVGDWIITVAVAILTGGGAATMVTQWMRRGLTRAEASEKLTDSAIELLEAAKRDARQDVESLRGALAGAQTQIHDLDSSLRDARVTLMETQQQMHAIRAESEIVVAYLNRVVSAIHDPVMTMDRLRTLVGSPPPSNGVGTR